MVGPSKLSTNLLRQTFGERFLKTSIFERILISLDRYRDNSDTQINLKIRLM